MDFINIISQILLLITIIFLCVYTSKLVKEKDKALIKIRALEVNRNAVIVLCFNFIVIGIFTFIYYYLSYLSNDTHFLKNGKPHKLSFFHAMYECFITQTTVGYGDIEFNTNLVKFITMLQMSTLFINFGLFNI